MWQRLRPTPTTTALTAVMGATFLVSGLMSGEGHPIDGRGWLLLAFNVLPLLWLDRNPLVVTFVFGIAYPLWAGQYPISLLQSLPTLAALGAVGAAPKPLWWRALGLLLPVEMMAAVLTGVWEVDPLEIGYVAIVFVVVWALGLAIATRREHARALEVKTVALHEAREELARRAVVEERTRIARDLHDIVAHAMSVITVQAGVGAHLIGRDPSQAEGALRVIEETGRSALEDMRRLLRALRSDDATGPDSAPVEPRPGLDSLDQLAAGVGAAGIPVQVQVEGAARPLAAGIELAVYRIAQEALTNTVKHAPGARAELTLRYRPGAVELEVVDRGGGPDPAPNAGGQGLVGMRERVALYGGSLAAGRFDGGFRVLASFPVAAP